MIVGRQYKMLSELGAGGMGIVFQGVDTMLEREVAIKKLRSEFSRSADVAERFRKEAKIQARMNHPGLAHLYSFFKEDDAFYIVMEFVGGAPLSKMLPMPWQDALRVFAQVLESIQYAHSLDVLHRDIKPDNIMVLPRGEVKVMDFGIAHVLGSVRQTREKTIIGTLEYMSPEQISGKELTPRSDLYSLGILLFEMISGHLPFQADSEFALLHHHLETPMPKLTGEYPEFLDRAIEQATAKAPADRFSGCRAMADFLRQSAPEVFAAPGQIHREVRAEEVARCVTRIEALIGGEELDLAALVVERALADYPGQATLSALEAKMRQHKQQAAGASQRREKANELRDTLAKLAAMETAGDLAGARSLAREAAERDPRIPALRIALAYLQKE